MKITKNHIYIALVAFAAAGWAFDTLILEHGAAPTSAAAEPLPASLLVEKSASPSAPAVHKSVPLAERFDRAPSPVDMVADAFAPPPEWIAAPVISAIPAAPAVARSVTPRIDADTFRHAHKLTALLVTGGSTGTAVIDGVMVPMGGSFAGLTLAGLTKRTATLHADGCDIVLQLDTHSEPEKPHPGSEVK